MNRRSTLGRSLRRAALILGVAAGFLIVHSSFGASTASAAKLGVSIRGSITDPGSGLSGDGWGTVVETTPAHKIACTFPTAIYCNADYGLTLGTQVSLRADAPPGWRFDHWIQGGDGQVTCDTGTSANVCRFNLWFWDLSVGAYFVDETAPDVILDSSPPPATNSGHAVFAFHSPDNVQYNPVHYVCKAEVLDPPVQTYNYGCGPSGWDWPMTYDGHYRVTVIGLDASGNADPSPPVVAFTVDRVAPDTAIGTGPTGTVWQRNATFAFSGTDPNGGYSGTVPGSGVAGFQCRLDGAGWNACSSGVGYDQLGQGSHTFEVRAVDAAGNADPTVASRTWTVTTPGCYGQLATMVGTAGNDVLTGTAGPDVIAGLGGNDTIDGLGGTDRICGNDGSDSLRGGPGADYLDGGSGVNIADYQNAPSAVALDLSTDPGTASTGDGLDPALLSIQTVRGSSFGDSLTGSDYAETLIGNKGDDVLKGLGGNDTLRGGPGADSLDGGAGTDTADYQSATAGVTVNLSTGKASGADGSDPSLVSLETVRASQYGDSLTGSSLADSLFGLGGNDTIAGLGGNDALTGGPGADTIQGGDGNDTAYARDSAADHVDGGAGTGDRAQIDASLDVVTGNEALIP